MINRTSIAVIQAQHERRRRLRVIVGNTAHCAFCHREFAPIGGGSSINGTLSSYCSSTCRENHKARTP